VKIKRKVSNILLVKIQIQIILQSVD